MLVDGNNLLMRCIKAMEYSGLRNGENWQTGPLTAFVGALARFVRDHKPTHLVVCWDHGPSERRKRLYPEYKSARKQQDPEAEERKETAFGMTKEFLRVAGVQQVSVRGYEADDVVAAYWGMAYWDTQWDWAEEDLPRHVIIVSGDKDFLQLLDRGTKQLRPDNAGNYRLWTGQDVEAEYGVTPSNMPNYMALVGDAVDGVPGVRGIGPKKALRGLQEADWDLTRVGALANGNNHAMAILSLCLVDLRDASWHPDVPKIKPFAPVSFMGDTTDFLCLLTYLRALGMETLVAKLHTNTLWS